MTPAPHRRRPLAAVALACAALLGGSGAVAPAVADDAGTGARTERVAEGRPDTLFPHLGSAAYDARHYDVALRYDPADNRLHGLTTLTAHSPHRLARVVLDFEGLHVTRVLADGRPARSSRHGVHLVVTPRERLGHDFTVTVAYRGVPTTHIDADDSPEGWVRTADGAIGLGEPVGTMDWVPCNNTPGDKATWTFAVDVPRRDQVASNGDLVSRRTHGSRSTWRWRETAPMTTYLATVAVGRFALDRSSYTSIDGRDIPILDFTDHDADSTAAARAQLPEVLAFEEKHFGPYPFTSAGMIVDPAHVGYALETQTRPFYDGAPDALVHEMAHQWYGDSLSVVDWHDLWLAEGFATYAEWLWTAAHGGESTQAQFDTLYAKPASDELWHPAPTRFTSSRQLFGDPVYQRGAMTLQVLRERVGDADFARILKAWAREHRHGSVRTGQFERLAERISGRDLSTLFHDWLVMDGKPSGYSSTPAG